MKYWRLKRRNSRRLQAQKGQLVEQKILDVVNSKNYKKNGEIFTMPMTPENSKPVVQKKENSKQRIVMTRSISRVAKFLSAAKHTLAILLVFNLCWLPWHLGISNTPQPHVVKTTTNFTPQKTVAKKLATCGGKHH